MMDTDVGYKLLYPTFKAYVSHVGYTLRNVFLTTKGSRGCTVGGALRLRPRSFAHRVARMSFSPFEKPTSAKP